MPDPVKLLSDDALRDIEARHTKADGIVDDHYSYEFAIAASLNDIPPSVKPCAPCDLTLTGSVHWRMSDMIYFLPSAELTTIYAPSERGCFNR